MLLTLLLTPLVGAAILGAWRGADSRAAIRFAVVWSLLPVLLVAALGFREATDDGTLAAWALQWIPDAGIALSFAVDGTAWVFLLLTALVTAFSLAISARFGPAGRGYAALILAMESMLLGVFTAQHFIPFFLCWEMTLIPAYLLIRLWGGPGAPRAARRFFVITLGGGVCMLLGFLALQVGAGTMDFARLSELAASRELAPTLATAFAATGLSGGVLLTLVAIAVLLGLAVKIPIVPFHAWLPDAYAEAPTPVTILLTGLLSKMGVYALLRVFLPIFPETFAVLAPWLAVLAVVTVLLGAVAALAQTDLKRLLAYSSVNHLGYCVLAAAAIAASQADRESAASAFSGAMLQAINHGIIATALFFGIAILESRSGGLRGLDDFGGLRTRLPVFCGLMGLAVFASLGLPGLSGFVGEFLIFNGAFGLLPWAASVSVLGLLLTAVFLLRLIRKVFAGPLASHAAAWPDLTSGERGLFAAAVALIVLPGLWPDLLLRFINPDTLRTLDLLIP